MFMTDFARALPLPTQLEFMAVSSYGSSTSSSGVVRILKDLDRDIAGRDVLIVEDIVDSGLTLSWLLKNLASRNPASLKVVSLLRKPEAVRVDVPVRYVGFDIPTGSRVAPPFTPGDSWLLLLYENVYTFSSKLHPAPSSLCSSMNPVSVCFTS